MGRLYIRISLLYPFTQKNKRIANQNLPKRKLIEPLIYEYLSTYFNDLIRITMEDEDIIWDDNDWYPNEEL
jgi:hypothetical protein